MELNESYNLPFVHIEEAIAQVYREGIINLRSNKETPDEELKIVLETFNALEQSHPSPGMGIEWASEIIPAYRNLARIVKEIPFSEDVINSLFSRYASLFDDYKKGLPIEKDSRLSQLEKAVKELNEIKGILKERDYEIEELRNVFQRLDELEEKIKQKDEKSTNLENL